MVLTGMAEADIDSMFRNGVDSLWQIGISMVVISAIYPYFGFGTKKVITSKDWNTIKPRILVFMEAKVYDIESEGDSVVSFRIRGVIARLTRMFEDRVTIATNNGITTVTGPRKDIIRIASALDYIVNKEDE